MKKKIKLRDLTKEQWNDWVDNICNLKVECENCPIYRVNCDSSEDENSWINNKDLYSDKFLDQEVEIEISDILDKEEKEYLSAVIKPFRNRDISISKKAITYENTENKIFHYVRIKIKSKTNIFCNEFINLPYFNNEMYKGMEDHKEYTLEELGL